MTMNMHITTVLRSLFLGSLMSISGVAIGQPPKDPAVISPQVNPDRTVVFRYLAPSAKEVKLNAQFEKALVNLIKDDRGI